MFKPLVETLKTSEKTNLTPHKFCGIVTISERKEKNAKWKFGT